MSRTVTIGSLSTTATVIRVRSDAHLGNAVRKHMADLGDTSWDVADIHRGEDGFTATRVRREERPGVRKTKLAETYNQMDELIQSVRKEMKMETKKSRLLAIEHMKTTIFFQNQIIKTKEECLAAAEVNEKYEATDRCLRAFNELIFDTTRKSTPSRPRVLDQARKNNLKSHRLVYITNLLDERTDRRNNSSINADRLWALDILTPDEQLLCRSLYTQWKTVRGERNVQQHPVPDIDTALRRTEQAAGDQVGLLKAMLSTDPKRIKTKEDKPGVCLELFARPGHYVPVVRLEEELAELKKRQAALEQQAEEAQAEVAEKV